MSVSSIQSSSVSSLDYLSLLATQKKASTSSSGSSSGATDSLTLSLQAQILAQSQTSGSNPFQADFENLGSLIQSGDLAGAKQAFSAMAVPSMRQSISVRMEFVRRLASSRSPIMRRI